MAAAAAAPSPASLDALSAWAAASDDAALRADSDFLREIVYPDAMRAEIATPLRYGTA
jgi:hypothetical protein